MNGLAWIVRMAWRDSRASRRRLFFFSLSIALGVAALVAITSFRDNLRVAILTEAKGVLGADLELSGRGAFGPGGEEEGLFRRLGGEQARQVSFTSMAVFPRTGDTRLVQVRALEGAFPFYGEFRTAPAGARARLDHERVAIVEESLLQQFGLAVGETVRLGEGEFAIAGALQKSPGEAAAIGALAPRIYLPLREVPSTGLLREGSFARYKQYFRFARGVDAEEVVAQHREDIRRLRLRVETVNERQQDLGEALGRVYSFLNLAGFVALLLGAVGVASAMHLYVKPKVATVATLRCLGAGAWSGFGIYLLQGLAMGLAGAAVGAVLGVAVQFAVPGLLERFLPFSVEVAVSWRAVAEGMLVGLAVCTLFALWPLLAVRRVSPLRAIRADFEERGAGFDVVQAAMAAVIAAAVLAIAFSQSTDWRIGLGFALGIGAAFGLLAGAAHLLMRLLRRRLPRRAPYVWRQGLANLYRPNNRTVLMIVALGVGTFLVLTLYLTRGALLAEFARGYSQDRPNLVAWDVQPDQEAGVLALMRAAGLEPRGSAPVVTMRLAAVRGRTVEQIVADPQSRVPGWRLRREYRSTYRGALAPTEEVLAGTFTGRARAGDAAPPVSVEQEFAREVGVGVGDEIVWDVQGVPVKTTVGSIRKVDWRGFNPNFFVVFPEGVLESAPLFHLIAARAPTPAASVAFQRSLGREFSGVSIVDLRLILETVDTVVRQVGWVVQFMALFTVLTGVIVLAGAVLAGRFQRVREAVLLRTLGASRAQVEQIQFVEYALLGTAAALVGAGLAWAGAWALVHFVFRVEALPPAGPVLVAWVATAVLTVLVGWLTGRRVVNEPPLSVLRAEG